MPTKTAPLGICDQCGKQMPRDDWYTSKGQPRRYCDRQCRNTGNSRAGADIRSDKALDRVARGVWVNPADINPPTPEEQSRRSRLGRQREVADGTWRNPALTDEARQKLSRPRKHDGDLHAALEKLRTGSMADLTDAEAAAHREYQRSLRDARKDEINQAARERYQKQQAALTDEEREQQRQKWRNANQRRTQ